jgi:hypothetical protein
VPSNVRPSNQNVGQNLQRLPVASVRIAPRRTTRATRRSRGIGAPRTRRSHSSARRANGQRTQLRTRRSGAKCSAYSPRVSWVTTGTTVPRTVDW